MAEPTEADKLKDFGEFLRETEESAARRAIRDFCREVNRRAEDNMIKTGKLEGSHFAAMRQILAERGIEL